MHILLFILIFIIAIFVFGLSIIGFILRTIFGLGRGSSSSRPKQTLQTPFSGVWTAKKWIRSLNQAMLALF